MVSTKIQNNKTSSSPVPSAEWNWIGDIFNSTTQNTTLTIGTGTFTSGAIYASGSVRTSIGVESDAVFPVSSSSGVALKNKDGTTVVSVGVGSSSSTNSTWTGAITLTGNLTQTGVLTSSTLSATNISSSTITNTSFASFKNYVHGNTGTATTINWNNGAYQSCTLTGNCTFAFTGVSIPSGDRIRLTLYLAQDSTGSRTATWPSSVRWSGSTAPTLTTTGTVTDIATFIYDGNRYAGVMSTNVPL